MPPNWNRYIRRHTELDLIISDKNSIFGSYFKIGPWVSFCLLKKEGQPWMGGEVIQTSCKYMNRKAILPPNIMDFLKERAENSKKLLDSISQKQKANIEKAIIEGDLLTNGRPMYEAIMADVEIFGTLAFADK